MQKKYFPSPRDIETYGAEVKKIKDVMSLECGGRPFSGAIYTFDPYENRPWQECVSAMYEDGVRIFSFLCPLPLAWDEESRYDFSLLDELHDGILKLAPEALLIPRLFLASPDWWDRKYQEELIGFRNTVPAIDNWGNEKQKLWKYEAKMYHSPRNPSLASEQWKSDAGNALSAYVRHVMSKYPGHFFCFQPAYGTCGEWGAFGSYIKGRFGNYDFSRPMVTAFRWFLLGKYGTDEAIRAAWKNPEISLATAEPPTKLEQLKTGHFSFKNPSLHCQYADWIEHYYSTLYDTMDYFCKVVKDAAERPVVTLVFGGYRLQVGASAYMAHTADIQLDRLLEKKHIDALTTPNWYVDRRRGIASQAPVATIAKSKLFIAECDVRAAISRNGCGEYTPAEPRDEREGLSWFARDTFFNMTQGQGLFWWYDFGQGWYLAPEIRRLVRSMVALAEKLPEEPVPQAEIAVVIDEQTAVYSEGCAGYFRQFRSCMNHLLPFSGIPFDVITLDDMLRSKPYKLYVFRELFHVGHETRRKIRDFVTRHHSSCVWFHAAGAIDENSISAENSSSLTGIRMRMHDVSTTGAVTLLNSEHPLCQGMTLPLALSSTDDINTIQGPVFSAEDPEAEVLGQLESLELPGIVIKQDGNRFDLWSSSPLLAPEMWRNIGKMAGCQPAAPAGVMTFGTGNHRMFLSPYEQDVEIAWGKNVIKINDALTGEAFAPDNGRLSLKLLANSVRYLCNKSSLMTLTDDKNTIKLKKAKKILHAALSRSLESTEYSIN